MILQVIAFLALKIAEVAGFVFIPYWFGKFCQLIVPKKFKYFKAEEHKVWVWFLGLWGVCWVIIAGLILFVVGVLCYHNWKWATSIISSL